MIMQKGKSAAGKGAFIRICAGCGEHFDKRVMFRIAKRGESVFFDADGNSAGRGVYVCVKAECIEQARKNRRPSRSLRANVPEQIYEQLLDAVPGGKNDTKA